MPKNTKSASRPARIADQPACEIDASGLQVVPVRGESVPRVFIHLLANFLLRTDRGRRDLYFGDLDLASIAATVGVGALEADMRDADFRQQFNDYMQIVGAERQRPLNAHSVAMATGLPRETVRRKLKTLVQKGVLLEKDGGYIYRPGHAQRPDQQAVFEDGLRDTVQLVNLCLSLGILRLSRKPGAAASIPPKQPQPAKLRQ